ncbi:MAG: Nif3-like dinuclear metal center hexameric protein [Paludibacteraceae bacterium]|nr:Nif3-like dinuclear metal center hexameric protein [Paludibacteraceae bacterium]
MKIREITQQIEDFAPLKYQESFDNSGIQVGDIDADVKGVLLCIDITEDVVNEAIEKGCNLIISHHPLIFRGIKKITPENYISRTIIKAIENQIVLYSSHTNMDKAPHGVNYHVATKLGIVVEKMLCSEKDNSDFGLGVVGELQEEEDCIHFLKRVKTILNIGCIRHTDIPEGKKVKRIALCGGSGNEFLPYAIRENADIYLTGDLKYHQFFETEKQIIMADFGHFESEQFTKEIFYEIVSKNNANFAIYFSDSKTNPINYI